MTTKTVLSTCCPCAQRPLPTPWQGALVGSPPVSEDPKSRKLKYEWCNVGVLDYDKEKKLYLVHKTDKSGLVRDGMEKPILKGGVTPEGTCSPPLPQEGPRLRPSLSLKPASTQGMASSGLNSLLLCLSCGRLSPDQGKPEDPTLRDSRRGKGPLFDFVNSEPQTVLPSAWC